MKTKPNTSSRHMILEVSASRNRGKITEQIADYALLGSLYVLSGAEWLPSYALTRMLRRRTVELDKTMRRVRMARAFTCYQMLNLLETTRPEKEPLLILDLLHIFYNPDIHFRVRIRVLNQCVGHLRRLWTTRPLTIFIRKMEVEEYQQFYPLIARVADEIVEAEEPSVAERQLALF